jgi:hypothetical protein
MQPATTTQLGPLRVSVLSEGAALERWQAACLGDLRRVRGVVLDDQVQPITDVRSAGDLAQADVVLSFATSPLDSSLVQAPRLGVWSFHFGQWQHLVPEHGRALGTERVATGALVRLTGNVDRAVLLKGGFYRSEPTAAATSRAIRSHCSKWPAQVCIDLLNGERAPILDEPLVTLCACETGAEAQRPWRTVREAADEFVARASHTLVHEHWSIGVVRRPIVDFLDPDLRPQIHWLDTDGSREFAADPFGITLAGRRFILYEQYDRESGRGRLSSVELTDAGFTNTTAIKLGPEVHRSYPYTFEYAGNIYAIPETSKIREVGLYRAEHFPRSWTRVKTLLTDVDAVDSTVFRDGGRWWLACSSAAERDRCADLFLWYAGALEGPWKPHANNPVKSDVRSARPGGTPFHHDGALHRPAQDCSVTYGGRIVINRVLRLSPTAFEEEPVSTVEPDPDGPFPDGLHTLSSLGNVTLVDGKRRAVIPAEVYRSLSSLYSGRQKP